MEVSFSSECRTRLRQVALANGKNAEQLVRETVSRMLESQSRFIDGLHLGIEQTDRGETLDHEEVRGRLERLFIS